MTYWEKEIRNTVCSVCAGAGSGCDDPEIFCAYGSDMVEVIRREIKQAVDEIIIYNDEIHSENCALTHEVDGFAKKVLEYRGIK